MSSAGATVRGVALWSREKRRSDVTRPVLFQPPTACLSQTPQQSVCNDMPPSSQGECARVHCPRRVSDR